jgi:hypothetical protein
MKEETVAAAWKKAWFGLNLTRVQNNAFELSPLRGGIVDHNNALESGNSLQDKVAFNHKKVRAVQLVDIVANYLVGRTSRLDVMFHGKMKGRSKHGRGKNTVPNNTTFFKRCWDTLKAERRGDGTCLSLQFAYTDQRNDVPRGSFLVATNRIHSA